MYGITAMENFTNEVDVTFSLSQSRRVYDYLIRHRQVLRTGNHQQNRSGVRQPKVGLGPDTVICQADRLHCWETKTDPAL